MAPPPLQFWFDFGSTYSYPAALRIEKVAGASQVAVSWKPFLLGPIFKAQGWSDSPFKLNPLRGRYMWTDIERLCRRHALPFRKPSQFPRNGLLAARIACQAADEPWCPEFCRSVFRANFAEDRDIADPKTIAALLRDLNVDGERLIGSAQTPESKDRLRRQTDETSSLGLFGAPHFVIGSEIFWGHDRLEEALAWYRRPW